MLRKFIACINSWCRNFSPLDEIIDALGGSGNVAEMTGRKARMVRLSPGEAPRYETRGGGSTDEVESLNVREVKNLTGFRWWNYWWGIVKEMAVLWAYWQKSIEPLQSEATVCVCVSVCVCLYNFLQTTLFDLKTSYCTYGCLATSVQCWLIITYIRYMAPIFVILFYVHSSCAI